MFDSNNLARLKLLGAVLSGMELDASGRLATLMVDRRLVEALLDGLSIQTALDDPVVTSEMAFQVAMRFASSSLGFPWKYQRKRSRRRPKSA